MNHFRTIAIAFFLTAVACTQPAPSAGGSQPAINATLGEEVTLGGEKFALRPHPRVWLTPERLERLRTKDEASNPAWVGLQDAVQKQISSGDYKKTAEENFLFDLTLAYLATDSPDYLAAAKEALLNFPKFMDISCDGSKYCGNDNIDYGSEALVYLSASYDWLHAKMTEEERKTIRDWVYAKLIPFLRKHSFYGDPLSNLGHTKWIGEMMWALASLGDDERSFALADEQYSFWRDKIAPFFDAAYPGGHSYGGSGYGYNRSYKFALYGMEALSTTLSFDAYARHPWAKEGLSYRIHSVLPTGDSFHADWESSQALYHQGRQAENEALMVSRFQGTSEAKFGQFYINEVFRPRPFWNMDGNRLHPIYVGRWFLWYDHKHEQASYYGEPTTYWAPGCGLGFSRSRWADASASWLAFSASSFFGDHQLHNEGSLKLWRDGEYLLVENGRCYAANAGDLTPIDANILFLGPGAVAFGQVTGGLQRRGVETKLPPALVSQSGKDAFFDADITPAYDKNHISLSSVRRGVVHLKSASAAEADMVVVADRISSPSVLAKKAYFYLPYATSIAGKTATMKTTSGKNQLVVRSLQPSSAVLSLEAVTDKTNGCHVQEATDKPVRLVINGGSSSGVASFLTVFQMGGGSATLPAVEAIESADGKFFGAMVVGSVSRGALLSKEPPPVSGTISFTAHPTGSSQWVIGGLPPNSKYALSLTSGAGEVTIQLTPSATGGASSDAAGVLRATF